MTITTTMINRVLSTDNVPESIGMTSAVPHMGETVYEENIGEAMKESDAQQTTDFVSDGVVVESVLNAFRSLPSMFNQSSEISNSQDIKTFLAKPVKIHSDVLSTTDVLTTQNHTFRNPEALLSNSLIVNKLSGFLGFRATMCVRIVINATPFHMGRYMLVYVPTGGAMMDLKGQLAYDMHLNTLYERTQLQGVQLDLTCDTEGLIRIPYNSVLNFYPLSLDTLGTQVGSLGIFRLCPYSPLETLGGTSSIGYTIYAHFEDVELIGAAIPQMGISPSEKESKAAGVGPVSSVAFSFSKAARALSDVPVLSSFASTTSWALDVLGKTAKSVGFSKPPNYAPAIRNGAVLAFNIGNVDGYDQSATLAGSSENSVSVLPGFAGTDIDEMDFRNLISIPAWFQTISWGAQASGSLLTTIACSPLSPPFYQTRTIVSRTVYNFTPLSYVSSMFNYYRGSLVFKIKFVKTVFHSGRLAVCFSPTNPYQPVQSMTYELSDYLHREIIDIRTCNEVTFTVPYTSIYPWIPPDLGFGNVYIYVVDKLSAPSNVPSSIKLLMEINGGADTEFAWPRSVDPSNDAFSYGLPVMGATPQMGLDPCELVNKNIGSTVIPSETLINSELCVGEKISSLRALTKIFRPLRLTSIMVSAAIESQYVFATNFAYFNGTVWNFPIVKGDLLDMVSPCYLYSRGSYRFKKISTNMNGNSHAVSYIQFHQTATFASSFIRSNVDLRGHGVNITQLNGGKYAFSNISNMNGAIEVTVPQYTTRHSRVVSADMIGSPFSSNSLQNLGSGIMMNTYFNVFAGDYVTNAKIDATVTYRASGDDFSLGGFISTVPLYYDSGAGFL